MEWKLLIRLTHFEVMFFHIDEESTLGQAVQSYVLLKLMDQGQYLRNYWREHIEKVPDNKSTGRAWDSCRSDSRYTRVTQNYWPPKMDGFKKMFQDSRLSITKSVIRLVLFFEAIAIWFLQQNHEFKVIFQRQEMEDALRNLPMPVVVNMASEEEPPGTERHLFWQIRKSSRSFFSWECSLSIQDGWLGGSTQRIGCPAEISMGFKKTWPPGQGLFQRWVFASQHPSDQGAPTL